MVVTSTLNKYFLYMTQKKLDDSYETKNVTKYSQVETTTKLSTPQICRNNEKSFHVNWVFTP